MRGRELELELSTVGRSELVRERVCGLNAVGPKTVETQFNRSDRLAPPVRPVWP